MVHLFSATHFTYNKRKAIKKSPLTTGLLALTGTVLLVRPTCRLRTANGHARSKQELSSSCRSQSLTTPMTTTMCWCWQAFLVLHLKAFRFSDSARRWRHPDALPAAPSERDLYYLMLERFARPS